MHLELLVPSFPKGASYQKMQIRSGSEMFQFGVTPTEHINWLHYAISKNYITVPPEGEDVIPFIGPLPPESDQIEYKSVEDSWPATYDNIYPIITDSVIELVRGSDYCRFIVGVVDSKATPEWNQPFPLGIHLNFEKKPPETEEIEATPLPQAFLRNLAAQLNKFFQNIFPPIPCSLICTSFLPYPLIILLFSNQDLCVRIDKFHS